MEKEIKEFDGIYTVTNTGEVYSYTKGKRVKRKPVLDKNGYETLTFTFRKKNQVFCRKIHRLVAEAYIPNPNNLPQVNHLDGNKRNNCVSNLEWCSNEHNYRHMLDNNLKKKGCKYKNNTSGFYGVIYGNGKYTARIRRNRKNYYLGRYDSKEEAYDIVKEELKREEAGLPIREYKIIKKIKQFDKDYNLIQTYKSISEAELKTGIANQTIGKAILGKRKYGGGYIWKREQKSGLV